jgi:hypothetical protein
MTGLLSFRRLSLCSPAPHPLDTRSPQKPNAGRPWRGRGPSQQASPDAEKVHVPLAYRRTQGGCWWCAYAL